MNNQYRQINQTQATALASTSAILPNCVSQRQFPEFGGTSFTLAVDNSAGVSKETAKMQSADDVAELINDNLGDLGFTVNELPDRAGLGLGGADLLGIDGIRKRLLMFGLLVQFINYAGSSRAQLRNP